MKRILRYLPILLLGVLLLAGCEKDKTKSFKATTAPYNGTKAYISNGYACWMNGDKVKINSTVATATVYNRTGYSYVMLDGIPVDEGGNYYAIYPASAVAGGATVTASTAITLPPQQTYRTKNGHQVIDAPMAAQAIGDSLVFENLCVLLRVHMAKKNTILKSIVVKSVDGTALLSGSGTVTFTAGEPSLAMNSGYDSVELVMESGANVNVSGGIDFYIAIPALAAGKNLYVYAKDFTGERSRISLTTQMALPSNTILEIPGPVLHDNTVYEFYDYIYSAKSGYIDLGVRPAVNAKMEMTYMVVGGTNAITNSQYLGGSRGKADGSDSFQWMTMGGETGDTTKGFYADVCSKAVIFNEYPRSRNKKYIMSVTMLKNSNNKLYGEAYLENLTDGLVYPPKTTSESTKTGVPSSTSNIHLFGFRSGNLHTGMRCYNFKYYTGGALRNEFVACKRLSDNVVGVYDMKNDNFIVPTPASGSAPDFVVGND